MNKDLRFNPGRSKQAQEVIFSWKTSTINHSCLTFNSTYFEKAASQKHLGMVLDSKLNFKKHISQKIDKANKGIVITGKLRSVFPRSLWLTLCDFFVRPQLDYGGVICDQSDNSSFI